MYCIKGKEHTNEMVKYLNGLFDSKGIEIRSVIITNVVLDNAIADILEEKATYTAALNALEKKKYIFEVRVLNDEQEYALKEEKMKLGRDMEMSKFNKSRSEIEKMQRKILAETDKIVAEINEFTRADVKKVDIGGLLEAQAIINETNMLKTVISSEGTAKSKKVLAEAEWYSLQKEAEAHLKASSKIADEIKIKGKAEAQLAKNLASRRKYEFYLKTISTLCVCK